MTKSDYRRSLSISPQFPIAGGEVVLLYSSRELVAYANPPPPPEEVTFEIGFRTEPDHITRFRSLEELHAELGEHLTARWLKKNATAFARFFVAWTKCGRFAEVDDLTCQVYLPQVLPLAKPRARRVCEFHVVDDSVFPRLYRYRVALDFSFERELIAKSKKRRMRLF